MKETVSVLKSISKHLVSKGETLAIAESVTSGRLQAELSLADKATDFFQGGLTAYNLGQKVRHLHVDPIAAGRSNCVSLQISSTMALSVCNLFSSDWGIAVTGYASPMPERKVQKILFAWLAIAYHGLVVSTQKIELKKISMLQAQEYYVKTILVSFDLLLKKKSEV
jgi:nicotinamide-nucleotide amidase